MHKVMPKLILAQRGLLPPQSQHESFPGIFNSCSQILKNKNIPILNLSSFVHRPSVKKKGLLWFPRLIRTFAFRSRMTRGGSIVGIVVPRRIVAIGIRLKRLNGGSDPVLQCRDPSGIHFVGIRLKHVVF